MSHPRSIFKSATSSVLPTKNAREQRAEKFESIKPDLQRIALLSAIKASKNVDPHSLEIAPVPGPNAAESNEISLSSLERLPAPATVQRDDLADRELPPSDVPIRPTDSPLISQFVRVAHRDFVPSLELGNASTLPTNSLDEEFVTVSSSTPVRQVGEISLVSAQMPKSAIFSHEILPSLPTPVPLSAILEPAHLAAPLSSLLSPRSSVSKKKITSPKLLKSPRRPKVIKHSDGFTEILERSGQRGALSAGSTDIRKFMSTISVENRFQALSKLTDLKPRTAIPHHINKKLSHTRDKTPKRDVEEIRAIANSRAIVSDSPVSSSSSSDDDSFVTDDSDPSYKDSSSSSSSTRRERKTKNRQAATTLARTQRTLDRHMAQQFGARVKALAASRGIRTVADRIDEIVLQKKLSVRRLRIAAIVSDIQTTFSGHTVTINDEVVLHSLIPTSDNYNGRTGIVTDQQEDGYFIVETSNLDKFSIHFSNLNVRTQIIDEELITRLLDLLSLTKLPEALPILSSLINGNRNPHFQIMLTSLSQSHARELAPHIFRLVDIESKLWDSAPPQHSAPVEYRAHLEHSTLEHTGLAVGTQINRPTRANQDVRYIEINLHSDEQIRPHTPLFFRHHQRHIDSHDVRHSERGWLSQHEIDSITSRLEIVTQFSTHMNLQIRNCSIRNACIQMFHSDTHDSFFEILPTSDETLYLSDLLKAWSSPQASTISDTELRNDIAATMWILSFSTPEVVNEFIRIFQQFFCFRQAMFHTLVFDCIGHAFPHLAHQLNQLIAANVQPQLPPGHSLRYFQTNLRPGQTTQVSYRQVQHLQDIVPGSAFTWGSLNADEIADERARCTIVVNRQRHFGAKFSEFLPNKHPRPQKAQYSPLLNRPDPDDFENVLAVKLIFEMLSFWSDPGEFEDHITIDDLASFILLMSRVTAKQAKEINRQILTQLSKFPMFRTTLFWCIDDYSDLLASKVRNADSTHAPSPSLPRAPTNSLASLPSQPRGLNSSPSSLCKFPFTHTESLSCGHCGHHAHPHSRTSTDLGHSPPALTAEFAHTAHTTAISAALAHLLHYSSLPNFVPIWNYDIDAPRKMTKFDPSWFQSERHRRVLERMLYSWYCHNKSTILPTDVEEFMSILNTLSQYAADQVQTAAYHYFNDSRTFYDFIRTIFSDHHHHRSRVERNLVTDSPARFARTQGPVQNPTMPILVSDSDTSDSSGSDDDRPAIRFSKPGLRSVKAREVKSSVIRQSICADSESDDDFVEKGAQLLMRIHNRDGPETAPPARPIASNHSAPSVGLSSTMSTTQYRPHGSEPPREPTAPSREDSGNHGGNGGSNSRLPTRMPTLSPPSASTSAHQQVLVLPQEKAPRLTASISDIPNLVKSFLPLYRIYSRAYSRQNLQFQTIFECFSEQQQRTLQLSSMIPYTTLMAFSNDELLEQLTTLWGLKTAASTFQSLRTIKFQGDSLDRDSWILLQADFTLILDQAAPRGLPSDKELAKMFISLCPFGFMRQELTNANVRHWEQALQKALELLNDVEFVRAASKLRSGLSGGGGSNSNGGNSDSGHGNGNGNGSSRNSPPSTTTPSQPNRQMQQRTNEPRQQPQGTDIQRQAPPRLERQHTASRESYPATQQSRPATPFIANLRGDRPPERHIAFNVPSSPYPSRSATRQQDLCTRCGMTGHDSKSCIRNNHMDGSVLPKLDEAEYARRRALITSKPKGSGNRVAMIRDSGFIENDDYSDDEIVDHDDHVPQTHTFLPNSADLLEPPLGCGFILRSCHPPSKSDSNRQIIFAVDSRCQSNSVIKTSLVKKLKLEVTKCAPIISSTASCEKITCTQTCTFTLGIFIHHQWNYFCITAMVWPDLCDELIICNTFALSSNLIRFVLPQEERISIIGRPAITDPRFCSDFEGPLRQDDDDTQQSFWDEVMSEKDENLIDLAAPLMFNAGIRFSDLSKENQDWARLFPNFLLPFPEHAHPDIPEFDAHILMDKVASYSSSMQQKKFYKPIRSSDKAREKFADTIAELRDKFFVSTSIANPHGVASIAHLIPKPNGKSRFVVNCSGINKCLQMQMYPLPTIQEAHAFVGKFKCFATLDLESGYFNMPIKKESRWITRTIGPGFAIEWLRCTQGLAPMVSFFQWAMTTILIEFKDFVFVYLDDVLIGGNTKEECSIRLHAILKRLHDLNFRISFKKSQLSPSFKIDFLGRTFVNGFIVPGPNTSILLSKMVHPGAHSSDKHARTALRSFLGAGNYLRPHMPNWTVAVAPLYSKGNQTWSWSPSDQSAWDAGMECLKNLKPLELPSNNPGGFIPTPTRRHYRS
jgi:ribosomal protein L21E